MKVKYDKSIKQIEDKVLSGAIPSGQLLKDCILRHRRDLETGKERGIYFDHEKGLDVIKFAELLNDFKNEPAELFWWQKLEYSTSAVRGKVGASQGGVRSIFPRRFLSR